MTSNDWLQQIKDSLRQFGKAFEAVEGARLILSFSSVSEEEYTPDPEQLEEDRRLDLEKTWVVRAETTPSETFTRDFRRAQNGFKFVYFVDGSVRSVRALEGQEGNFIFPIVISQIGAASVTRNDNSQPVRHFLETDIVLLIPLSKLSDTLRTQLKRQLAGTPLEERVDDPLCWRDARGVVHYSDERDYARLRSRAARRAKDWMTDIERHVIERCVGCLSDEHQLVVMDGSLFTMLKEARICEDKLHQVIAISKSFSMKPLILMEEHLNRRDCVKRLVSLKEGERTDAIELHIDRDWVVTWYQRIRPPEQVESPLDGIVKVETHFLDYPACKSPNDRRRLDPKVKDWSAIWDAIANIVYSERMPVPFHEERWHSLLYPIYCCEQLLKSSFLSIEVLRGLCAGITL
ncbi:MAG: hypothetical protein OGMRLDGQ_002335 [Candidatus Fervidibacter sp.]|jgi:DNA-binding FrmR family transcriptional regulator